MDLLLNLLYSQCLVVTYTFNQTESNSTHAIYFSESEDAMVATNRYETGVVYKINELLFLGQITILSLFSDGTLSRSVEITPAANSPDTLYYVCQNHLQWECNQH